MAHFRFRCLLMLASFLLFVSVGFMMPATSFAKSATHLHSTASAARSWSVVASPNQAANNDSLASVAAVSASDVWAVGSYVNSSGFYQTLIEQWNGSSWSIVASPNQGSKDNRLYSVAAVSATDIWAVGYYQSSNPYHTLIEHWNGSTWSIVPSPNQGTNNNGLNGVAAGSANNVWAVGYYLTTSGKPQTLTEQWNGSSWSIIPSPNQDSINDVLLSVVVSPNNNVWAVGYYSNQTLTEQWNGSSWSIVPSPSQEADLNRLYGVTASSANDIWAVGYYSMNTGVFQSLIEHWDGTSWSIVPSPNNGSNDVVLSSVARVSASNIWAVGSYSDIKGAQQTLTEHWNGTSWSIVATPHVALYDVLSGVAAVPGSINLWAVGYYFPSSSTELTLTEYYG